MILYIKGNRYPTQQDLKDEPDVSKQLATKPNHEKLLTATSTMHNHPRHDQPSLAHPWQKYRAILLAVCILDPSNDCDTYEPGNTLNASMWTLMFFQPTTLRGPHNGFPTAISTALAAEMHFFTATRTSHASLTALSTSCAVTSSIALS